jgi:esterase/lipase superfamily enzyme
MPVIRKKATSGISSCPAFNKEVAIYVHGLWTNETMAKEQVDRVRLGLAANNYSIFLIGFGWDSDTTTTPHGREIAKTIAYQNGPKLAQFILDFKNSCPDKSIRLISHSLGAAVINSTLISLDTNPTWKDRHYHIASVHLMAPAINNDAVSINTPFGHAIENILDRFYTLYDPEDDILQIDYVQNEHHAALGLNGADNSIPRPTNYIQQNVQDKILAFNDADGDSILDCASSLKPIYSLGDNHCGYLEQP